MQKLILEAVEILEDKFKIKPQRTKLFLYEDINSFLTKINNPKAQSIFLPKDLSAHVPLNRLDLVFHEYFGHGLYCEQTKYGKKMFDDEQNFPDMNQEKIIAALLVNEKLKPTFEAHALWTEDFLLRKMNKEDILRDRVNELSQLKFDSNLFSPIKSYADIYNLAKNFEQQHGVFELWYNFGFPRQFDPETLLEIAKQKLGNRFNDLTFLIHFGSKNKDGDIDLCAVLNDKSQVDDYLDSRTIDLTQFNYFDFIKKVSLFDITVTQPIMTGTLVYGDSFEFEKIKNNLKLRQVPEEAITYLQDKSKWCLSYADNYFNTYPNNPDVCRVTLNNLSYALSFMDFARKYRQGSKFIILKDLDNLLLSEIRTYMKSDEIEYEKVRNYIPIVRQNIN